MTTRYTEALLLAARAHDGDPRKGTSIPYITHPVAVSALVAKYGGDDDLQIAALLHDVLEDGGPEYESEVARFGARVLRIVKDCTDGVPDATGIKPDWLPRKEAYLQHLADVQPDALLVSACDKLHNATAILEDLREIGLDLFNRFSAPRERTLWYYERLAALFTEREVPVAAAVASAVGEVRRLVTALEAAGAKTSH